MVHEELEVRLNDSEYKNWLKAGRCLLILKDGFHPFVNSRMRAFHRDLLNQNSLLRTPCETSSCKPRANKLSRVCRVCSMWQTVILKHHRQPDATVNWDNCSPPSWRTDHWELAKAYMPRGQVKVKGAHECDASALLNLINYCSYFNVDVKYVKEVIRYRNELMHSCDFRVKNDWMRRYRTSLTHLVQQFSNVPEIATVEQQINDMLAIDLSVYVSGLDQMDSADLDGLECDSASQMKMSADLISQWEAELLQERLQELLHAAAAPADDDTKSLDAEQLMSLGGFLQDNRDLAGRFSAELQAINSLKIPLLDCEVCCTWRDVILAYHSNPNGKWSKPHLWSQNKWEVAKLYMPHCHNNHNSTGEFDISALLCLMSHCKHFKKFEFGRLCQEVSYVRNNIMHTANYQLKKEDLHNYLRRVKDLSEVLAKHHPDFRNLSQDIDETQNVDFRVTLPAQDIQAQHEKELEDKLFAALEVVQRKVEKLKQILSSLCVGLKITFDHHNQSQE